MARWRLALARRTVALDEPNLTPITHSPYSAPLPSFSNFRLWIERTHLFGRRPYFPLARICRIPIEVLLILTLFSLELSFNYHLAFI
jgi:hypothetical protein